MRNSEIIQSIPSQENDSSRYISNNHKRPNHPNKYEYPEYAERVDSEEKNGWNNFLAAASTIRIRGRGETQTAMVAGLGLGNELTGLYGPINDVVIGLDIAPLILDHAKKRFSRWIDQKLHLVQADISDLCFPAGEIEMTVCSSTLHEVQSYGGYRKMLDAVNGIKNVTAPGGLVLLREFYPFFPGSGSLRLKTDTAREFFKAFHEKFNPSNGDELTRVEQDSEDYIHGNRRYIEEVVKHFVFHSRNWPKYYVSGNIRRMLNWRKPPKEKVFAEINSAKWEQLYETYTLSGEKGAFSSIGELLDTFGFTDGQWAYAFYTVANHEDDEWMKENFSIFNETGNPVHLTDRRFVLVAQKDGKGASKNKFEDIRRLARGTLVIDRSSERSEVYHIPNAFGLNEEV